MSVDSAIALTSLAEVLAYLGSIPTKNGLTIYSDNSTATAATVEVTDTTMILTITGGLTPSTNTLTFGVTTLGALITAINILAGWKATAIYNTAADSTDLIVTGALGCLGTANTQTLKIADYYLINELINRASDLINRYCDRILKSSDYVREIYVGEGQQELLLDQYPATRIARLSRGRANSFTIRNTSTDANYATVEITASAIRLIVDGGANVSDTSLTLATYTTIDALIAAITAAPTKGWSVTTLATDTASRDASELLKRPSMFVDAVARADCETVDEDLTDYLLRKPTEARNEGIVYYASGFTWGREFFINYTAGYTTIPYALEQICIELVKYKWDWSKKDATVKSEQIGRVYSYTLQNLKDALSPDLLAQLDMFRRREVL